MTKIFSRAPRASVLAIALTLAGCANDGTGGLFATGSVAPVKQEVAAQPAVDPACVQLVSQVDGLRKDGIAERVEKAAKEKYKLKKADLAKVDQLNKANAELQSRCSTITPAATAAVGTPTVATPAVTTPAVTTPAVAAPSPVAPGTPIATAPAKPATPAAPAQPAAPKVTVRPKA